MVQEYYTRTVLLPQNTSFRVSSPFIDRELAVCTIYSVSGNGTLYISQDTMISPLNLNTPLTPTEYDGLLVPVTAGMWLNADVPCQTFVNFTYASSVAGSYATISYTFKRDKQGMNMPVRHLESVEEPQPQYKQESLEKLEVSGRMMGNDKALPVSRVRGKNAEKSLTDYLATIKEGNTRLYGNE
jgi:hypothetical protein